MDLSELGGGPAASADFGKAASRLSTVFAAARASRPKEKPKKKPPAGSGAVAARAPPETPLLSTRISRKLRESRESASRRGDGRTVAFAPSPARSPGEAPKTPVTIPKLDFGVPLDMAQALAPAGPDESASADGVPEAKAATPSPRSFSLFGDDAAPASGDEESVDDLIARAAALRESAVASGELEPRAPEEPAKPEEAAEKPAAPEEPAAPSAPEPPAEPEPAAKAASPPKKPGPIGGAEPSTPARPAPADELTFESAGTARSRRSQG